MDDTEVCAYCGEQQGFDASDDGFYYCRVCYTQVEGAIQFCWEESDMPRVQVPNGVHYVSKHRIRECHPPSDNNNKDASDLATEIVSRYVMGIQIMIQSLCEALVRTSDVSPLICGVAGPIWFRYLASTRVCHDEWADQIFKDSELNNNNKDEEKCLKNRYRNDRGAVVNIYGESVAVIWFRALRKKIPLSTCLSVCYLACHVLRQTILPTDIYKWALEGKLPYLTAFLDVEKQLGHPPTWFPSFSSSSSMFKPFKVLGSRELESQSASIAKTIGLELPPLNFPGLALRFLKQFPVPLEKVLPHAVRVREWSMPPNLWLSVTPDRLPSRTCVMAIIILTLRMLYNINGFGIWEKSLANRWSDKSRKRKKDAKPTEGGVLKHQFSEMETAQLLNDLNSQYDPNGGDAYEYAKELPKYLTYCKDVVFAGIKSALKGNEEDRIIEQLWRFYEDEKPTISSCNNSTTSEGDDTTVASNKSVSSPEQEICRAVKAMKLNMEENGFCYIPPRERAKRFEYLHYTRKNDGGGRTSVAHADYYILLRTCAQVAQVSVQDMHTAALDLEKRISDIETRVDHALHFMANKPSSSHQS